MEKSTEDCPCKRQRVSEDEVNNETVMVVDTRRNHPSSFNNSFSLPTEGASPSTSTPLSSAVQTSQTRPSHTASSYSGFWDFSDDAPCKVLERKPKADLGNESNILGKTEPKTRNLENDALPDGLDNHITGNVSDFDGQSLKTDTSNELLQHELFLGPKFQNVRKDVSNSSNEPKVDKSEEKLPIDEESVEQRIRYLSGACQYVQNVQAITENMHLQSRQDAQLVESIKEQIESQTVQSTETAADSKSHEAMPPPLSEKSALHDNTSPICALKEKVFSASNDSSSTVCAFNEKITSAFGDQHNTVNALNEAIVSVFGDRSVVIGASSEATICGLDVNSSEIGALNKNIVNTCEDRPQKINSIKKELTPNELSNNADDLSLHCLLKQTVNPMQRSVDGYSIEGNPATKTYSNSLWDKQSTPTCSSNSNCTEVSLAGSSCLNSPHNVDCGTIPLSSNSSSGNTVGSRPVVTHPRVADADAANARTVDNKVSHPRMVDSGFIEMFTNSVMSSVFSRPSSSSGFGNTSGSRSLNMECGFSGLGNVLDDMSPRSPSSKMSNEVGNSKNVSSHLTGSCFSGSPQSDLNTTLSSGIFDNVGQGHFQVKVKSGLHGNISNDVNDSRDGNSVGKTYDTAPACRYRPKNKLFHMSDEYKRKIVSESEINSLPVCILLQVFKNLSTYCLLRRVGVVCKYWYNLCRDQDLWRAIHLTNQHRLEDDDLSTILKYSDYRVRSVNLTDCRFLTNKGIADLLASCRLIEDLRIIRCSDVTDVAFATLQTNEHLVYLNLDGSSRLTDNTIRKIAECCPNLRSLHLNHCTKVTNDGVNSLARKCRHIVELQLNHCCRVGDACISEIVIGCPNITCLHLMSCGISDTGVKYLSKLSKLRNLDLSHVPRITSESVIYSSKYCKHIDSLNVSLNGGMDDSLLSMIAINLKGLKRLYCVSCNISDTGLIEIAENCPLLEALDVGWCQGITDNGVRVVSLACKHLEYFGLIRCDQVTVETIEELEQSYPHINYSTFALESRRLIARARREGYRFELI